MQQGERLGERMRNKTNEVGQGERQDLVEAYAEDESGQLRHRSDMTLTRRHGVVFELGAFLRQVSVEAVGRCNRVSEAVVRAASEASAAHSSSLR